MAAAVADAFITLATAANVIIIKQCCCL